MKKKSFYNNYVEVGNGILLFNALSRAYVLLKPSLFAKFDSEDLESFKQEYPKQYQALEENGIIVDENLDEVNLAYNIKVARRFKTSRYHIIVNPTLNCNLGCWYCYESHIASSAMSTDTADRVIKNFSYQYAISPYKVLLLSFFGGEPLLKTPIAIRIIEGARKFAAENGVELHLEFTTNGTLLSKELLEVIKDIPSSFQITLDGYGAVHDKVRHFKGSDKGTYSLILEKLKLLSDTLHDYILHVRVNITPETFDKLESILNDLAFLPKDKSAIRLHQVWQVSFKEEEIDMVDDFVVEAMNKGYDIAFKALDGPDGCYANNLAEAVVNYNGDVYKCTARDFSTTEREGVLNEDGSVMWNYPRIMKRLNQPLPQMCVECSLMPACSGVCSQTLMETDKPGCHLGSKFDRDRAIIRNYYVTQNRMK